MKTRVQIALMGCLASVAAHLYLTLHYYPLKFGFAAGNSICNLNAKFDCDAVAASGYSSLFGIPLSVWGLVTNAVLFFMILFSWLEWSEHPERLKRWTLLLAGGSFVASLVMGVISFTQLNSYCLFCLTLYVLSAIIFFAYRGLKREPLGPGLTADLPHLWSDSKSILLGFAAIPLLAYLTHQIFMQNFGDAQVEKLVNESVQEWTLASAQNFVAKPTMVMGPSLETAALTLVEFADFRCSHCRHASYTLDAFVKSHPDVRFEFYSFPLDGECNEKIESKNGISCLLATAVFCAEKEGKGWELHHSLYNAQDDINHAAGVPEVEPILAQLVAPLGLSWDRLKTCTTDPAVSDAIRAQAKQGVLVNVMGTPTLFANGKLLNRGQMMPVLQAVREKSLESARPTK